MPAALDVNWNEVRTLAIAIGLKAASERLGLPYDAVRQRSSREEWFTALPRNQTLPATVRQPVTLVTSPAKAMADELADLGSKSRLSLARGLAKASDHIATMEGPQILDRSADVKQTVQSIAAVHGWAAQSGPGLNVNLRLAVTAQAEGPVLEAEVVDDPPSS